MTDQANTENGTLLLSRIAGLIEQTKDLDYDPSMWDGEWVCGEHGEPECKQGQCPGLPWPEPNGDDVLSAFTLWAQREFLRIVRPYDQGLVPEMPDESFRSYSVSEWPVGAMIEAFPDLNLLSISAGEQS